MKIAGLVASPSPVARTLTVVRFARPLDVAAQERARAALAAVGVLDAEDGPELEETSCFVAGTAGSPEAAALGRIREVLEGLGRDLGATEAHCFTVGTEVDAVAASEAEDDEDEDDEDEDEDDDAPASYWKAGPPPRETTTRFALDRYPEILEAYDWEDFGIAVKLGGPPVPGERTLLDAFHTFWLDPYVDANAVAARDEDEDDEDEAEDDDGPALPWRHAQLTWDARHRAGLLWVDRFTPPATEDEIVHHLVWVVARLAEVVPVVNARFDHATMAMKYGHLTGDARPPFVLAGNPLLARFVASGEGEAMAWAESQRDWDKSEVAAMFVELGQTHDPDEAEPAKVALRMFERALALDPENDDAATSAITVLARQGRVDDAIARVRHARDDFKGHLLGELTDHQPGALPKALPLLSKQVLGTLQGQAVCELLGAAAKHAPEALDPLLAAVPDDPELVAYVFNAFAATEDPRTQLRICLRAIEMPLPEAGPHRTAWLTAMNNANVFAHTVKDYDLALSLTKRGEPHAAENPHIHHAAACAYAAVGRHEEAFEHVRLAVEREYEHLDRVETDTDLGPLLEDARFKALFEARRARLAKSEPVLVTTDDSFRSDVLAHGVPVLVDFTASWCGPCQRLAPLLERLAAESGGRYRVVKIDVDENAVTTARFGVKSMPTMVLFRGGEEVARQVGLVDLPRLRAFVAKA